MEIHYFSRSKQAGYSIQAVFQTIINQVKKQASVRETYLPSPFASVTAIIRNGIYAMKRQQRGEINHVTGDVHYLLYFLRRKKTVVTVHDIMYYHYLQGFKKFVWKLLYIYPLKRAACVTFISEFAKQQVLDIIHLPEDHVKVIPNPVSPNFRFEERPFNVDNPRILHIGTLQRKNLQRTILALRGIVCHLCIVGTLDETTSKLLRENNICYSNLCDLDEIQIVQEYRKADIINFPSLFEGFGMPIIEGQMTGRVVVTSALSPMKDVAGEGALLVDPYSVESIHKAYLRVIGDEDFRNSLIRKGRENVSRFTADKVTEQYIQIYKRILQE